MKITIKKPETMITPYRMISICESSQHHGYLVILEYLNKKGEVTFAEILAEFSENESVSTEE